jgi:hypothetical protein
LEERKIGGELWRWMERRNIDESRGEEKIK